MIRWCLAVLVALVLACQGLAGAADAPASASAVATAADGMAAPAHAGVSDTAPERIAEAALDGGDLFDPPHRPALPHGAYGAPAGPDAARMAPPYLEAPRRPPRA